MIEYRFNDSLKKKKSTFENFLSDGNRSDVNS